MRFTPVFFVALTVVFLVTASASATIIFDVDNADELSGSFTLPVETDLNERAPVNLFNHFRQPADSGRGGFAVGSTVNTIAPLILTGENVHESLFYGTEQYDSLTDFPDRSGTYTSPFDGRSVEYQYTDVSFSANVPVGYSGDFSFRVVPEPSSVGLFSVALVVIGFCGNRRRKRTHMNRVAGCFSH
jgi:hypothetical protein